MLRARPASSPRGVRRLTVPVCCRSPAASLLDLPLLGLSRIVLHAPYGPVLLGKKAYFGFSASTDVKYQFNEKMMLGQGGYDVVYDGTVLGEHRRSVEVAVKQFSGAYTKGAVAKIKVQGGCEDGEEVLCRVHRSGSMCV